jgi:aspartate kinase
MSGMAIVVQKYGGSSVATVERIRAVALRVAEAARAGDGVVVVVSARGKTTDELLGLAAQLTARPAGRELDQLLATGEAQSMALLALALDGLGIRARSLSGGQAGIRTAGRWGRARIARITTGRLRAVLAAGEVAIVAGFQGVNGRRDVQTLGRGGSDTTAVALAAALGAGRCDIFTDVDGVYTADPRLVPDAIRLTRIGYAAMAELAWRGAKVMHPRAIELGALYGVEIAVRSSLDDGPGTLIGPDTQPEGGQHDRQIDAQAREETMEQGGTLSGVVHDARIARITVAGLPGGPATLARIFGPLAGAEVSIDVIAESTGPDGTIELGFTVASDELATALPIVEGTARALGARVAAQGDLAKVSLVGTGMLNRPGYVARLFATLAEAAIPCLMVSTSEISITCVIPQGQAALAVARLHECFRRDFVAPAPGALLTTSGPPTASERGRP